MNGPTRQKSNSTDPRPRQSSGYANRSNSSQRKQRTRGTRGARRRGSSAANRARAQQEEEEGQTVNDPAARQQMKQTIAIEMMTTPVFLLPFPLQLVLGLTTLIFPQNAGQKREEAPAPSEQQ